MNDSSDVIASKIADVIESDVSIRGGTPASWLMRVANVLEGSSEVKFVGGTVRLTTTALTFEPNALNRYVQDGDLERAIDLAEIGDITEIANVPMHLVVVSGEANPGFAFRCYGATEFVSAIRAQMKAVGNVAHPAAPDEPG